ncbi:carboxymuconolactone decarboxylase family protein [Microvirga calopogonii]|uniref:carboxymuconolactone decarboxylase family protein n=1 Tax=Microvirga calopogonii TaxID=2078013 RepID=UPI000E0DB157|nr:alkylhydroperoxidase [Microvirga calopogonii]
MFLQIIEEEDATGEVAEIYEKQRAQLGFVMEAAKCFTARPDLLPIYTAFSDRIRAGFSLGLREWRLITLIAAKHIPSTYCSHVYSRQLTDDLGSKDAVLAVQRDFRAAGLSDKDVAMLAYAEKIVRDASRISPADIERLRQVGFSDRQICDIALCASFRCFVSRFFDAMGAGTEAAFLDEDEEFRTTMSVGRPL